jgi:hypothetical protein
MLRLKILRCVMCEWWKPIPFNWMGGGWPCDYCGSAMMVETIEAVKL